MERQLHSIEATNGLPRYLASPPSPPEVVTRKVQPIDVFLRTRGARLVKRDRYLARAAHFSRPPRSTQFLSESNPIFEGACRMRPLTRVFPAVLAATGLAIGTAVLTLAI